MSEPNPGAGPTTGGAIQFPAPPISKPSQNDAAYERLKRDIVALRLKPGDTINEAAISAELKIGRTPVNKALHRLMHEGFVKILPRKGVLVQPLSMDAFADLIAVRRLLEPACAALAAEHITGPELERMGRLLEAGERLARGDLDVLIDLDRDFHETMAQASRNAVLAEVLAGLHARSVRFWALSLQADSHLTEVMQEHAALLSALHAHDPAAASAAIYAHIESFARTFVARTGLLGAS